MSNTPRGALPPVTAFPKAPVRRHMAAPVTMQQTIVEDGRKISVKSVVETIPAVDLISGCMTPKEMCQGMKPDLKVLDMYVHIVRIEEGPSAGKAYVFCHHLYQIAKGQVITMQAIAKAHLCTNEGVDLLVGRNIVQMLKFSTHGAVSVRTNLTGLTWY